MASWTKPLGVHDFVVSCEVTVRYCTCGLAVYTIFCRVLVYRGLFGLVGYSTGGSFDSDRT